MGVADWGVKTDRQNAAVQNTFISKLSEYSKFKAWIPSHNNPKYMPGKYTDDCGGVKGPFDW